MSWVTTTPICAAANEAAARIINMTTRLFFMLFLLKDLSMLVNLLLLLTFAAFPEVSRFVLRRSSSNLR